MRGLMQAPMTNESVGTLIAGVSGFGGVAAACICRLGAESDPDLEIPLNM